MLSLRRSCITTSNRRSIDGGIMEMPAGIDEALDFVLADFSIFKDACDALPIESGKMEEPIEVYDARKGIITE